MRRGSLRELVVAQLSPATPRAHAPHCVQCFRVLIVRGVQLGLSLCTITVPSLLRAYSCTVPLSPALVQHYHINTAAMMQSNTMDGSVEYPAHWTHFG